MKEETFQQKEIIKILGIKKQRWEYLVSKLQLKAETPADGTGTVGLYSWTTIFECAIGHILSMWGFSFKRIWEILKNLHNNHSELFSWRDSDWESSPEDLIFCSKILKEDSDDLEITYLYDIDKYKEFFNDSHDLPFYSKLSKKGFFMLNLDALKDFIQRKVYNCVKNRNIKK